MLKGLDPLLSADLLHLLASMGHGDDLALVDANHPAARVADSTIRGEVLRMPGIPVDALLAAILTVLPIDDFTDDPIRFMAVVGNPDDIPEAVVAMQDVTRRAGFAGHFRSLPRNDFYEAARTSFGVVQCGETRLYGNVLIRKGVVRARV